MRVGLVRHFKVKQAYPSGRVGARDVEQWFRKYDEADIEEGQADLGGIEWTRCYSSDMTRAIRTAEMIYGPDIRKMSELREIPAPTFTTNRKFPLVVWAILIRLSWLFHARTRQDIEAAKARVGKFLDMALSGNDDNVLIVSHGALMKYLRKELIARGYRGPNFGVAKNGKLYTFERPRAT
ncbi:MAG: histidine phosphatase family protein [Cohnella sp.]|nr:histidine phosphatase family protein [Cohnella sp.]